MNFIKTNIHTFKKRGLIVFSNTVNSIISPFTNIIFSLIIINIAEIGLWGNFVYYFLYASLTSLVLSWGNKEYLLREFSKNPAKTGALWVKSFLSRLILLLPVILILLLFYSGKETLIIALWAFLIYALSSFDSLVAYYRKFLPSVFAEIVSSMIMFSFIFVYKAGLKLNTIIILYFIYYIIKITWYIFMFAKSLSVSNTVKFSTLFDLKLLKASSMFFLLGLTGMLGSRIDQYIVAYFLPKDSLGEYQVLKNFLLYFQSITVFIVFPFVKNIYRLGDSRLKKLKNTISTIGILLIVPMIIFLWFILKYIYNFTFPIEIYILSGLFVLPPFFYLIVLYKLFKHKKEKFVFIFNLIAIAVSLTLSIALLPDYGITGCLIAGTVSGWITVVLYIIYERKFLKIEAVN